MAGVAPGVHRSQGGDLGGVVGRRIARVLEPIEGHLSGDHRGEDRQRGGRLREEHLHEDYCFLGLKDEVHRREVR